MSNISINNSAYKFAESLGINKSEISNALKGNEEKVDTNKNGAIDENEISNLLDVNSPNDLKENTLTKKAIHDMKANQFSFNKFQQEKSQNTVETINTNMSKFVVSDSDAIKANKKLTSLEPESFKNTLNKVSDNFLKKLIKELPEKEVNTLADACKKNLSESELNSLYEKIGSSKDILKNAVTRDKVIGTWDGWSNSDITKKEEVGSGFKTKQEALIAAKNNKGAEAIIKEKDNQYHVYNIDDGSSYAFTKENIEQAKDYSVTNITTENSELQIESLVTEDDFEMPKPGINSGNSYLIEKYKINPLKDPNISIKDANLYLSKDAINYTRDKVLHKSNEFGFDKPIKTLTSVANSIPMLAMRVWETPESVESVKKIAENAESTRFGNCQENACVAAVRLANQNIPNVEVFGYFNKSDDKSRHAFTVIGRDPSSDFNDPKTWGDKAVICDPYYNETYPASELDKNIRYKNVYPS
ncbi:MAG: hypothetical protein ACK4IX_05345, partial [Candidatus Sericytochromatia bacterium]